MLSAVGVLVVVVMLSLGEAAAGEGTMAVDDVGINKGCDD